MSLGTGPLFFAALRCWNLHPRKGLRIAQGALVVTKRRKNDLAVEFLRFRASQQPADADAETISGFRHQACVWPCDGREGRTHRREQVHAYGGISLSEAEEAEGMKEAGSRKGYDWRVHGSDDWHRETEQGQRTTPRMIGVGLQLPSLRAAPASADAYDEGIADAASASRTYGVVRPSRSINGR